MTRTTREQIQDETASESSKSALLMLGEKFGRSLKTNSKPQRRDDVNDASNRLEAREYGQRTFKLVAT